MCAGYFFVYPISYRIQKTRSPKILLEKPKTKKKEIILPSGRLKLAPAAAGVIDKNNCELLEEVCVGGGGQQSGCKGGWFYCRSRPRVGCPTFTAVETQVSAVTL